MEKIKISLQAIFIFCFILFIIACKTLSPPVIKLHKTFTLSLDGNPTTGYAWNFLDLEKQDFVELIDSIYVPYASEGEKILGGGGTYFFKFKSIKRGTVILKANYTRSWQKAENPKQKEFTVTIQ
ncbi:MAG: protease inhibitor I42 family protein [Treponemataceae bacterium]